MKHRLSEEAVRYRVWLAGILIGLVGGLQAWAWTDAAKDAAAQVGGGGRASPEAQRTSFENNQAINRMGARGVSKGGINQQTYQANQNAFFEKNSELIRSAAEECGLDVNIKDPSGDPLAGTDTDANFKTKDGKPVTYEKWKEFNDKYHQKVNEFLEKAPGSKPPDTGTDLMPDPETTPPEEFAKITEAINKQGGTAYKDPAAARFENAMAKGKPLVLNEAGSYVKELQGQANQHFKQAAETTAKANELAKSYGENSPEVQDLRAKAQIENSQGAKYISKIREAGVKIREQAGVAAAPGQEPPSTELTEILRDNRGADTIAQSERIGPLSKNALNRATESCIEDLARAAKANPQAAPACQEAIAESLRDLPMSQKGQAMEMIKTKYGSEFAKGVAKAAQGPTPGAQVMKGFGKAMKVIGPGLLIYDGYHRIKGAMDAPEEAKTYVAGKALGGFVGGLTVGAAVGLGVVAVLGAPVTAVGAAVVIGAGLVAGAVGYGVGDYAGTSLAGWMLESVRPRDQKEYDALAAKGLLDGSKDVYGQLVKTGVDPRVAQAAANAYKQGDVKTFRNILKDVREILVKNAKRIPVRRFRDLATNEVEALLDCLCSKSLGANPWVAQGYNLEIPADADPKLHSCGSLKNGPCMAQGWGCWRSFIRWGNPGIADCLAAFNVPTNDPWTRGMIDAAYQKPYEKPFSVDVKVEPVEFCPGESVTVTLNVEGGRGDYQFRYDCGWPLQRPKDGPKDAFTPTRSSSMTFTSPELRRGYYDGKWVYERPREGHPTWIQVWVTSFSCENGQEVPLQFSRFLGVNVRPHGACDDEPGPGSPKKPPKKTGKSGWKPQDGDQVNAPDGAPPSGETGDEEGGSSVPGTGKSGGKTGRAGGKDAVTKGGKALPSTSTTPGAQGPEGSEGPEVGSKPRPPGEEGGGGKPGDCQIGGGGYGTSAGDNVIFAEGPPTQRVRITIKGSDGFSKSVEGKGRAEITRPPNRGGSDTITIENLDVPGCSETQVRQYDTNGVPIMTAPGDLAGAEPGLGAVPATGAGAGAGVLGGFVEGTEGKVSEDTKGELRTGRIFTDSQIGETRGDRDVTAAGKIKDKAGWDAQGTKGESVSGTAAADSKTSWGNVMGDAVAEGVTKGAEAAAGAFGGAAADHVSDHIFKPKGGATEEGEAEGEGEEVAEGGKGGGGGEEATGKGSSGAESTKKSGTKKESKKSGKQKTIVCPSCGKKVTFDEAKGPPKWCPYCCAGPGSEECAKCGYRWCGKKGPSPDTCPRCGAKKGSDYVAPPAEPVPPEEVVPPEGEILVNPGTPGESGGEGL